MHTGGLKRRFENSEIPPTGVGGLFKCNLQRKDSETVESPNGSWWIVQILPCIVKRLNLILRPCT